MGSLARTVLKDPVHFLAFGFGTGLAPVAPGTAGTLLAVGLDLLLRPTGIVVRATVVVGCLLLGIWLCGESSRRLGVHDHPGIVWDEITGYLALMLIVPPEWPWILAGFLVFRAFDILKPWPIRDLDHRTPGGAGIMLDDLLAAVYGAVVLLAFRYFFLVESIWSLA